MAELPRRLWTFLCRWHLLVFSIIWYYVIFPVFVGVFLFWLTLNKDYHPGSQFGWIQQHALFMFFLSFSLILLLGLMTIYVYVRCGRDAAHRPAVGLPLPTQWEQLVVLQFLHQEYTRRQDEALRGAEIISVGLQARKDATLSSVEYPLLPSGSILQVYDEAVQGLLILGKPGVGKTTLLRKLALELLVRTENDPMQPIPIILNLSSWADKQLSFDTWLREQLLHDYGVTSRLSQPWLEHDHWLLLLDGLDEVIYSSRSACIEAINAYRAKHFGPLVVCSEINAYLSEEKRLALLSTVVVQVLNKDQVMDYLKWVGRPMAAVRAALRTSPVLQELITTPLMLQVVIATYRDKKVKDVPLMGSVEEQRQQIFERYVQRMLEQLATKGEFTSQQMRYWLTWLAQKMKQHHLAEFNLERLQPSWLPTKRSQNIYILLVKLILGLFGLVVGLTFGFFGGLNIGLILGLGLGLFFALFFGSKKKSQEIHPTEVLVWSWKVFWKELRSWLVIGLIIGLIVGLIIGLIVGLIIGLIVGLIVGLVPTLIIGLIFGLVRGLSSAQITEHLRIMPNQGIQSSGRNALRIGFISLLLVGLVSGLVFGLLGGLDSGLVFGLFGGLVSGLYFGMRYGGATYLEHYILRYILRHHKAMPWLYIHFLEEASQYKLLERIGGGYRFINPLFQEYLASNEKAAPLSSVQRPLPQ